MGHRIFKGLRANGSGSLEQFFARYVRGKMSSITTLLCRLQACTWIPLAEKRYACRKLSLARR